MEEFYTALRALNCNKQDKYGCYSEATPTYCGTTRDSALYI
jgi:hypothetical protein